MFCSLKNLFINLCVYTQVQHWTKDLAPDDPKTVLGNMTFSYKIDIFMNIFGFGFGWTKSPNNLEPKNSKS